MFYDYFIRWCEQKGVTPAQAAADMGLGPRTPESWRTGAPSAANRGKLQAYFGLTAQELREAAPPAGRKQKTRTAPLQVVINAADGTPLMEVVFEVPRSGPVTEPFPMVSKKLLASEDRIARERALATAASATVANEILRRMAQGAPA